MNIREVYSSKAIALRHNEVASNKQAYLGKGLFPTKKKTGLDLKWIKTSKGLPVSLKPSAFDTVSTIRSREGFKMTETEMAFFKESMLIKEGKTYTNTIGKKGTMYFYKVRVQVYDAEGKLIARTALKQCKYAKRVWTK